MGKEWRLQDSLSLPSVRCFMAWQESESIKTISAEFCINPFSSVFSSSLSPTKDVRFYGFIVYIYFARPQFLEDLYQKHENSLFNLK